ncbi:hypothetical protein B0H10DRAFT_2009634 [Mycena sp. CBHHK59/15]|nr:hypothetical protein B0H10DRAFT_2009634 [Mycena sp. CBHHK59/15]
MSRSVSVRKKSLRIPNQPLKAPIPPSLLQSPHLNSPQSIFRRAVYVPCGPSDEDERWLQDTVPQHGAVKQHSQDTKRPIPEQGWASRNFPAMTRPGPTPSGRSPPFGHKSDPNFSRLGGYFVRL